MNGSPRSRSAFFPMDPHADARGWVLNPLEHTGGGEVFHLHCFSVEPGASRGGHVHPSRDEHFVVLHGELTATDMETGEETVLSPDRPGVLVFEPGVPHVFRNGSGGVAVALCFSTSETVDGEDTVRL